MTQAQAFLGETKAVSDLIMKMHHAVITPDGGWCRTMMSHDTKWFRTFDDGSQICVDGDTISIVE